MVGKDYQLQSTNCAIHFSLFKPIFHMEVGGYFGLFRINKDGS